MESKNILFKRKGSINRAYRTQLEVSYLNDQFPFELHQDLDHYYLNGQLVEYDDIHRGGRRKKFLNKRAAKWAKKCHANDDLALRTCPVCAQIQACYTLSLTKNMTQVVEPYVTEFMRMDDQVHMKLDWSSEDTWENYKTNTSTHHVCQGCLAVRGNGVTRLQAIRAVNRKLRRQD